MTKFSSSVKKITDIIQVLLQLESKYDLEDTKSFYITHLSLHFWSNYICVNIFLDGYDKIMRLCLQAISPTTHYLDMHKKNDQPMNPEFTFFVLINLTYNISNPNVKSSAQFKKYK